MTIGQRIAALRKEQHLSQEELGEKLGVSRQSIYKWESDASLPEIDKLIFLSKQFGVSVGWLLGVEEKPCNAGTEEKSDELTEQQLQMVEEIVARYIAAQPTMQPSKRKKWPYIAAAVLLIAAIGTLGNLNSKLSNLSSQYTNLQNNIGNIQHNVNSQINGIAGRVEEVLKSQNNLTADYGTAFVRSDLAANTASFHVRAVPKTYTEGMSALFSAEIYGSDEIVEVPGTLGPGQEFSADLTCPLTDDITLSVAFINGDTRETQKLDHYTYLYSQTFPSVDIEDYDFMYMDVPHGEISLNGQYLSTRNEPVYSDYNPENPPSEIKSIRLGVFKNQTLIAWAEPCTTPPNYHGFEGHDFYALPDVQTPFTENDTLEIAALITDEYGREFIRIGNVFELKNDDPRDIYLTWASDKWPSDNLDEWTF